MLQQITSKDFGWLHVNVPCNVHVISTRTLRARARASRARDGTALHKANAFLNEKRGKIDNQSGSIL